MKFGVRVGKARNGKGLFASKDFRTDKIILEIKGELIHWQKLLKIGGKVLDNAFRYSENFYLIPTDELGEYINHSCEPNAGIMKKGRKLYLKAIKNIKSGEEITFDYSAITGKDDIWKMKCNCGSKSCRRVVRNFSTLPKELQEEYKTLGIVPKYILN